MVAETLERAIQIAVEAHMGQKDKQGEPYILHPLRVMFLVGGDIHDMMAAVLHDVIEDTGTTAQQLIDQGIPDFVVAAVEKVSRPPKGTPDRPTYMEFIRSIAEDPMASRIKYADLLDNMDPLRLEKLGKDGERLKKRYLRAVEVFSETYRLHPGRESTDGKEGTSQG